MHYGTGSIILESIATLYLEDMIPFDMVVILIAYGLIRLMAGIDVYFASIWQIEF